MPASYHAIYVPEGVDSPQRRSSPLVALAAIACVTGFCAGVLVEAVAPQATAALWAASAAAQPLARPTLGAHTGAQIHSQPLTAATLGLPQNVLYSAEPGAQQEAASENAAPKKSGRPPLKVFLRLLAAPFMLIGGLFLVLLRRLRPGLKLQYSGETMAMAASEADSEKPKWKLGQFTEQFLFFNGQALLKAPAAALGRLAGPKKAGFAAAVTLFDGSPVPKGAPPVVLVTGATGGVGKRCVEQLLAKGQRVRALVRDLPKAQELLAPAAAIAAANNTALELAVADVTQERTLLPEMFEGVTSAISCVAVSVAPKEGDTKDRKKYYQGIKFYDPEIVGDTPETVEYVGMQNLINALKPTLGTEAPALFAVRPGTEEAVGNPWGPLDDVVMGGVSESGFTVVPGAGEAGEAAGVFYGVVRTENNGGFVSVRTRDYEPGLDLSRYDGLELRVKGDGRRYKMQVRCEKGWDVGGYSIGFDTVEDEWQTIRLPWKDFVANRRAQVVEGAPPINSANIISVQILHSKFEFGRELNPRFRKGQLQLPVTRIAAYSEAPATPKIVHCGSAGATRWNRPGIDVEQEPPAVKMNEMLGGILTYKLEGEDVIRASGVPYAIVRPCALTEEPGGMPLETDQGDVIKGKISRDDVAAIMVEALEKGKPNVTFEVKSTIPFSQPWEGPEEEVTRDWPAFFGAFQEGITGKTVDGVYEKEAITA